MVGWRNGSREGLKIPWIISVWVRVPPRLRQTRNSGRLNLIYIIKY